MSEEIQSGLEVAPGNDPEIIAQPDANKYFINAERPKTFASDTFLQSSPPDARSREVRELFFLLALFAILSLVVAVGAGLGVGLAARHKPAPSSGPPAVIPVDSSAAIKTANLVKVITMTAAPSTTPDQPRESMPSTTLVPSTLPNTHSEKIIAPTSRPLISATVSSPICPADNRLIYIATNKPTSTAGPELEITNASLAYQIFCYTNYVANPPIRDLQTLYNLNSLHECLDACALYSFQTKPVDFPVFACTGIAWAAGATRICWLKSNVTSSSANGTDKYPGIDGAVMVE